MRRVGPKPEAGRKYRARPGAYAILPKRGKVLLTAQFDDQFDIQLPGGGVDPGESSLAALHREVLEETGWSITRPRRLGAFRRFVFMPEYDLWAEKICHIYIATPARKIRPISEPCHEALWIPLPLAANVLANEGDRSFVRDYASASRP
ncbi:MAG: NUDIX hydrolase [Pseudomonadota bacterium]